MSDLDEREKIERRKYLMSRNPNKKIHEILRARSISQDAVAKEIGMSRVSLNRYLRGHTDISSSRFIALCEAIGIHISFD